MAEYRLREGRPNLRGAAWDGDGVNFSLFSAHATRVELCLFDSTGGRELVPAILQSPYAERGILLRQNQGLSVTQTTNSAAGNTGWQIVFSVE